MTTSVAHALQTARLDLEPITPKHADEAWPHLDDSEMWTFFPSLRPKSCEHLRAIYDLWSNPGHVKGEVRENWACRNRISGGLVGTVQATIFPDQSNAYIAYGIFAACQRKGYGREAVATVVSHLLDVHDVERVYAEMDTRNNASFRLVESLGFRRVETRAAVVRGHGNDGDEYLYELKSR
ncbi:MAG TPA: GNAT family N-acetyltransferase [Candidatus Rubrimentiphilum sp.]|nr:GNAT family N-acetyltransferase [Candidatus Rubrimentiphilum sp.]